MDAREFNGLSLAHKVDLLWSEGVRLFEYVSDLNHINVIYSIFNFYIEVSYTKESYGLKNIKGLDDLMDWSGYMEKIKLDEIFKTH